MKTYDIRLGNEDIKLRLTLSGQMALKKKFKDGNIVGLVMTALDDAEVCAEVLTQALNYRNSENSIKNGSDLYDLLVDEGYAGYEGFGELLLSIAQVSGLITETDKERLLSKLTDVYGEVLKEDESEEKN